MPSTDSLPAVGTAAPQNVPQFIGTLQIPDTNRITLASLGSAVVIASPGAGSRLHIVRVLIHNGDTADAADIFLRSASPGTVTGWQGYLAADGGGTVIDYGLPGWQLTDNRALEVGNAAAVEVSPLLVNVLEYYISS